MRRTWLWVITMVAVLASVATACGSESTKAGGPLPDTQLTDVATGSSVSLRSLIPSAAPVLAWFWAPH